MATHDISSGFAPMTIERGPSPRFVASTRLARDVRLSRDARSLAFFLASIQPGETLALRELAPTLGMSPAQIHRAFHELAAAGYALADGGFKTE